MDLATLTGRLDRAEQQLLRRFPKLPHFLAVARLNRPIGTFLLLWPTLWALWVAAEGWPGWHLFIVFVLGTVLTRSAGCVMNDIADRDFDGHVKRTVNRPLAQGDLTVTEAVLFMGGLLFLALILVLSTNLLTVSFAIVATAVAGVYPFMKRYTYMPQAILGVAFSCGIPMAFSATLSTVPQIAWLLFVANLVWTVAYDTEYAMVDRDDDLKLGLRSSAILFGDMDKLVIGTLQGLVLVILVLGGRSLEMSLPYYVGLALAAALFIYQQYLISDRARDPCFEAFLNNHWVGLCVFSGIVIHYL